MSEKRGIESNKVICGLNNKDFWSYISQYKKIKKEIELLDASSQGVIDLEINKYDLKILGKYKILIKLNVKTNKKLIRSKFPIKKFELTPSENLHIENIYNKLSYKKSKILFNETNNKLALIMNIISMNKYLDNKDLDINDLEIKKPNPQIGEVYFVDFLLSYGNEMAFSHPFLILNVKDGYIFGVPGTTSYAIHRKNEKFSYEIEGLNSIYEKLNKGLISKPKNLSPKKNNIMKTTYFQINRPMTLSMFRIDKVLNKNSEEVYEAYTKFTYNDKNFKEIRKLVFATNFPFEYEKSKKEEKKNTRVINFLEILIKYLKKR